MAGLTEGFINAMNARAERGAPAHVGTAMERYGWSTRDVAQQFGVSERTARRWRQQDRIPARRAADWRDAVQGAARDRLRQRIERGGLKGMKVTGQYRVSVRSYKAGRQSPLRFGSIRGNPVPRVTGTNQITGEQMREVFAAIDAGDQAAADAALNKALGEAYGAPGLEVEDAESVEFDI